MQILINGCNGCMGEVVRDEINKMTEVKIACGVDRTPNKINQKFNVYSDIFEVKELIDVIIDFSHSEYLDNMLKFAIEGKIPLVIATTGYTELEMNKIYEASKSIPVFYSANTALGVNVLMSMVKQAAKCFQDDFDIDIIEKHHASKLDAPSGTAKSIATQLNEALGGNQTFIHGRNGTDANRKNNEIGIHSIRAGQHSSDHIVSFIGQDEMLEIHSDVPSLGAFAKGAIKAAIFLKDSKIGFYEMTDVLGF